MLDVWIAPEGPERDAPDDVRQIQWLNNREILRSLSEIRVAREGAERDDGMALGSDAFQRDGLIPVVEIRIPAEVAEWSANREWTPCLSDWRSGNGIIITVVKIRVAAQPTERHNWAECRTRRLRDHWTIGALVRPVTEAGGSSQAEGVPTWDNQRATAGVILLLRTLNRWGPPELWAAAIPAELMPNREWGAG